MQTNTQLVWKITSPGESTAYCSYCDVELELTPVRPDPHNAGGRCDDICPVCGTIFE
jgi:hypothetical protein